jgi:protein O-mannosyl-transferase
MSSKLNLKYGVFLYFSCVILIIIFLYFPVIQAPFLFDDNSSIVGNSSIYSLDLKKIYAFEPLRFIGYLSFALNFYFSKLNTLSYHLVNISVHILYILFSFLFIKTMLETPSGKSVKFSRNEKTLLALATVSILAIHPLSTFAVSYIVQRLAALTALFYVGALYFYLKARLSQNIQGKISWALLFILFLACSLFTKQNSFTIFPQLFFLEMFCFNLTPRKRLLFILFLPVLALGFYFSIRYNFIDMNEIRTLTLETAHISRVEYFFTQFSVLCFYLKIFFYPINLALDYQYPVLKSITNPEVFVPAFILIAILLIIVWAGTKKKFRLISYGIIFYFTAISIESSIIPIRDVIFLHRTYLPNLGLAFAIIVLVFILFKNIKNSHYSLIFIFLIWMAFLTGFTFKTNMFFQTPVKVWERVLEVSPGHLRAYQALGNHYVFRKEKYDKAREYIMKVYNKYPDDIINLNNLGVLLNRENKFQKAVECYQRVIQLDKTHGNAYANLGATYCNMGRYDMALDVLKKGYSIDNTNFTLLLGLGQLLAILAPGPDTQYYDALKILEQAEAIDDENHLIYYSKGLAWFNLKKYIQSEINFKKALEFDNTFIEAKDFLIKINEAKN